ncbi:MAG: 4Fe-4S dicluster domain-containing protein [Actinomycetes bacterium]
MGAAPTEIAIHRSDARRMGFFTDTTTCIGCKACEVACKQWNDLPGDELRQGKGHSYDYTGALSASTWRHVRFVETTLPPGGGHLPALPATNGSGATPPPGAGDDVMPSLVDVAAGQAAWASAEDGALDRWVFMSDVCKHCSNAGCLDACPTGALIRTEFETVIVQTDICNGCGYCVPACPFGVIERREEDGRVFKCTLCYDRLKDGMEPACAHACPTKSIQFGELEELRERADAKLEKLHEAGFDDARLYLRDEADGIGGAGAFFLLLDEPEVYGFPPDPVSTTRDLPRLWKAAAVAAGVVVTAVAAAVAGGRR